MANHSVTSADIRLAEPYLRLQNGRHCGRDSILQGTIVLQVSRAMKTPKIRLQLKGKSEIRRTQPGSRKKRSRTCTRILLDQAWNITKPKFFLSETLNPGIHSFPFRFALWNGLPETVYGLDGNHVSYELRAKIRLAYCRAIAITQPVRLFRTPVLTSLDMMVPQAANGEWPGTLRYSISIPDHRIPFGSTIPIDFDILPLIKGLRLKSIASKVIESYNVMLLRPRKASEASSLSRAVCEETYFADARPDETEDEEVSWKVIRYLSLPSCLDDCTQDTASQGIQVRHKLHISISIVNLDGHTSRITVTLPLRIQMLTGDAQAMWNNSVLQLYNNFQVPPPYGEHLQDELVASKNAMPLLNEAGYHYTASESLSNSVCAQNQVVSDAPLDRLPDYQSTVQQH